MFFDIVYVEVFDGLHPFTSLHGGYGTKRPLATLRIDPKRSIRLLNGDHDTGQYKVP
jgi:hypothetical protein